MSTWVVSGSIVKTSEKRPTSLHGPKDLFPMQSLFGGFTVYRIFGLGGICLTCIRYVIVLAILHILIGIGLTNKLQNRRIEL